MPQISDAERERRQWAQQQAREREQAAAARMREQEARRDARERERRADSLLTQATREAKSILSDADRAEEKALADARKSIGEMEKRHLGATLVIRTGATRKNKKAIPVFHWKTSMDGLSPKLAGAPDGFGPLLWLQPGGGIPAGRAADEVLFSKRGDLKTSAEHVAWARDKLRPALQEARNRYPVLSKLRNDTWFAELAEAAGIADSSTTDESWEGTAASGTRRVVRTNIPTLIAACISQEGLELTYAHRTGDTAERWTRCLPALRAAFKAAGVAAGNLRIAENHSGDIVLRFDDAPSSFPAAVAPPAVEPVSSTAEAARRYPKMQWLLGVDARGNTLAPTLVHYPHVLVAGAAGSGKSVWVRSVAEGLRVQGAQIYLIDGKRSDYAALATLPGVRMVTTEPAAHAVCVAEVYEEMEHRRAEAAKAKAAGEAEPYAKYAPVILIADEFATVRGEWTELGGKDKDAPDASLLAPVLRVGRETRCHVILSSQDIYVENVPQSWQDNMPLFVSLGAPSPRTLAGGVIPEALRGEAQRIGERITRETRVRGLYVEREQFRILEFQSFYGYSPGTTPPESAPTPELRQSWAAAEQVTARVPWLYPRAGLEVTGPQWRNAPLAEIIETPTVALTDRDGHVIAEREQFDPTRADWAGAAVSGGRRRRAAASFDAAEAEPEPAAEAKVEAEPVVEQVVEAEPKVEVEPEPAQPEPQPAPAQPKTKDEIEAAIKAHARKMGLRVPEDDDEPEPSQPEPESAQPEPSQPKPEPARAEPTQPEEGWQ